MTNETETKLQSNHNTLHIPSREEFHKRFGGAVYNTDFNTEYNHLTSSTVGSRYASRIESDRRKEYSLYREMQLKKGRMNNEQMEK